MGRRQNYFSHTEVGRGTISFGVVLTWELEVLAILKGGRRKKFLARDGKKHTKDSTIKYSFAA